jgi:hypothetical protein
MAKLKSELEVLCPCCGATLVIDTNLGRVIEHREPEREDKPDLDTAQRSWPTSKRGGSHLPAVRGSGEDARRRLAALRGGAQAGAAGADHEAEEFSTGPQRA